MSFSSNHYMFLKSIKFYFSFFFFCVLKKNLENGDLFGFGVNSNGQIGIGFINILMLNQIKKTNNIFLN